MIWGLSSRNDNIELGVIAEGERAERFEQNGCTINGKYTIPKYKLGETDAVDLLIVVLKYGSLFGGIGKVFRK